MEWFYEKKGQQNGPVTVSELIRRFRAGELNRETLVWREGFEDWTPIDRANVLEAETGEEMAVCAQSGEVRPKSEMVPYGDSWVLPEHREAFVQNLMEGGLEAGTVEASDYSVKTGQYLGQAWDRLGDSFWPTVGASALIMIIYNAAAQIPFLGLLAGFVSTPLFAGLYYYLLLKVRGEPARLEDSFSGFQRNFLQLFLLGIVVGLITGVCILPGIGIALGGGFLLDGTSEAAGIALIIVGSLLAIIPAIYLSTAWMFAVMLCIDRKIDFWPAMSLSMKTVNRHFFSCLLFAILLGFINLGGVIAFCLGVFVTFPWTMMAFAVFYEDVFGRNRIGALTNPLD